jgi:carbamoyltransferase
VSPRRRAEGLLPRAGLRTTKIGLFLDGIGCPPPPDRRRVGALDRVAEILDSDKVVGWFQGRMEYGPRSLGARSIIGDPRSPEMQRTMNLKIKYRESFRPFAPCVLREHVSEVFETEPDQDWPYMLFVADVRRACTAADRGGAERHGGSGPAGPGVRARSTLPAITHVDYSARVQTVDASGTAASTA